MHEPEPRPRFVGSALAEPDPLIHAKSEPERVPEPERQPELIRQGLSCCSRGCRSAAGLWAPGGRARSGSQVGSEHAKPDDRRGAAKSALYKAGLGSGHHRFDLTSRGWVSANNDELPLGLLHQQEFIVGRC